MPRDLSYLNAKPKANYRKETQWPAGKRQRLTRAVAKRLFDAMSTSKDSLLGVLQKNPDLPPHDQIHNWRRNIPWFSEGYREARKDQGEFLAQHCLELARDATPQNAHAMRIKYDIYKWFASKFAPEVYGDKPPVTATTVNVGFHVSAERLNEIRSKLDITRHAVRNTNGQRTLVNSTDTPSSVSDSPRSVSDTVPLTTESSTHGNSNDKESH